MMKYVKRQSVSETAGPELSIKNMKATMLSRTSIKMSRSRLDKARGYKVYRSSKKSKGYSLIATTKKNYIKDSKLGKNKYYYYKVRAYRGSNKKAYGNITGAQEIYTGSAPTSFTSLKSEGDTSIKIKWEKAVYSNGYEIYMCSGSKYVRLTVRKSNTFVAYIINSLKEGCAASRMHWRIRLRSARVMRASSLSSPPVIISRAVISSSPSTSRAARRLPRPCRHRPGLR